MRSPIALIVVAALGVGAGCRGDEPAATPSATVASTLSPSTTTSTTEAPPTPEEEVEAAYLKSWEVYADALLRLDGSRFPEVYVGDALALRREELADLVRANTPVRIDVEHDYEIVLDVGDGRAVVTESYLNHSVLLDGRTMEPLEKDPNEVLGREYQLRKVGAVWLVDSVLSLL